MIRPTVFLLPLLLLAAASPAQSSAPLQIEALVAKARPLANDPQWLALLHVNRGGTTRDRGESYVDDPRFFFAPDGQTDAVAEIEASVRALFATSPVAGDEDPRCRFVARHRWLARQLAEGAPDPRAVCPAYRTWAEPINPGRMTLVFPGSYLNSPSSMFGHTLLRIDPPADAADTAWLSFAVSFGAEVAPSDNSILYVWKGVGGGYPGRFETERYFQKIQLYGRMENRDLWEYPLALDPDEIAFLVDHLWELRGINFDYYFFDENCSYRLLELLEVARPSLDLTRAWRLSEAPVNTVRVLRASGVASPPLLRPSAERELRARIARLDDHEQRIALALAESPQALADSGFLALARERQSAVLATAYAEIVYRARRKKGRDPVRAQHSLALLSAVNERGSPTAIEVAMPAAPESGHPTRRLSIGGGAIDDGGNDAGQFVFGGRLTYHDLLDPLTGYLPAAELEIGDAQWRVEDSGAPKLERLELANVVSISARDAFFPAWSWRVRGAIERQPMPDLDLHSARLFECGGGVGWRLGAVHARIFADLHLEHSGAFDHLADLAAGPSLGLLGQHRRFNWQLDARPLYFAGGFERTEIQAAAQWHPDRDWGLRLSLRWRAADAGGVDEEYADAQLLFNRYF